MLIEKRRERYKMPDNYENNKPKKRNRAKKPSALVHLPARIFGGLGRLLSTKVGVIVVLLLVVLVAFMFVRTNFFATSRTVKFGLQDIGELATQEGYFTNVQVISDDKKIGNWSIPLTSSKYIFSYDGVIKAGIDFADIKYTVNLVSKVVTVTVPEIKILSCEIDEDSLEVYDESRSIFTPLDVTDMNESLKALKEEITEQAKANGLLEAARSNAEVLIKGFLSATYDPSQFTYVFK